MEISAERYVDLIVEFLEEVKYSDLENPSSETEENLRHLFRETMTHFEPPRVRGASINRQLTSIVRTITRMTAFGWGNLPRDVMVPLNIYFTYVILEDDPGGDPFLGNSGLMESFVDDFLCGREQLHPRFRSLFAFFPELLRCYGQFSQITMVKSTLELIQSFWLERQQFQGFPGASDYPMFLRRLGGLGDFSGAALFPAAQFDEGHFEDIVTVIAQIEPIVALVNDLFSFYKEVNGPEKDVCLVRNICLVDGLDTEQVLRQVADDSASAVRKLTGILERPQSEAALKTVNDFVRGYIRWHLCDERYRMKELGARCGNRSSNVVKFRRFHEIACHAGCVDLVDFHSPELHGRAL